MKPLSTPIGGTVGHPWPPEGTLIYLETSTRNLTFILGVVREHGKLQGMCLRNWNGEWRQAVTLSGDAIDGITHAFILEEGDELYDEASRRYMSLLLMGAAQ